MELTVDSNEFNKLLKEIVQQRNAIQRVRELHTKSVVNDGFPSQCTLCGYEYPCVTLQALDGEQ